MLGYGVRKLQLLLIYTLHSLPFSKNECQSVSLDLKPCSLLQEEGRFFSLPCILMFSSFSVLRHVGQIRKFCSPLLICEHLLLIRSGASKHSSVKASGRLCAGMDWD